MRKLITASLAAVTIFLAFGHSARADIVFLSEQRSDFSIWGDINIAGYKTIGGGHAAANSTGGTGQVAMDLANATATYQNLSTTMTGRYGVRRFKVPNGLLPDKQFKLTTSINESWEIYRQMPGDVTVDFTSVSDDRASTSGLSEAQLEAAVFGLSGTYLLEGPTESISGNFSIGSMTAVGTVNGSGGYPYGRHFRLARDHSGAIVDKMFQRETYMFGDFKFDFEDESIFDATIDGEQISMDFTHAHFAENILIGSAVPEPSSAIVLASLSSLLAFRRRR